MRLRVSRGEMLNRAMLGNSKVVIEGHMPAREAYYLDTRGRATNSFFLLSLGVWQILSLTVGFLWTLNLC